MTGPCIHSYGPWTATAMVRRGVQVETRVCKLCGREDRRIAPVQP